ncbi:unnamed protein product [marine sediment metagenome]|uniref:Uncharacterized protein n=1 Tax=marine sediment metagenome TaxID=412755 RepID=X1CD08_9ZZZZ
MFSTRIYHLENGNSAHARAWRSDLRHRRTLQYTHIEHTVPTHKKDINKKGALDCTVALFPDD